MAATLSMLGGLASIVIGLALWSVPAALIVGGLVLFVAGGLEYRRSL